MSARVVAEVRGGAVPLWSHPEWADRFPWLAQGTTGRGEGDAPFDLGLAGAQPVGEALDRWRALVRETGMRGAVHSRQVHGADLHVHREAGPPGVLVMDGVDGHLTDVPGLLVAVGVADCIPVSIVDPERRVVAMVHAGWRGVAAGIAERAVRRLAASWGAPAERLWLHLGPSICGACYEVGPEVHAAVRPDRPPPPSNSCIDLRAALADRLRAVGVADGRLTASAHCTRCGPGAFFSHRGGDAGRQMGVLGLRPVWGDPPRE